jgi:hypothetical protein
MQYTHEPKARTITDPLSNASAKSMTAHIGRVIFGLD